MRLSNQLFLAFLAVAAACAAVGALAFRLLGPPAPTPPELGRAAAWFLSTLPPEGHPARADALRATAERIGLEVSVYDADGALTLAAGPPLPPPRRGEGVEWVHDRHRVAWLVPVSTGGWLGVGLPRHRPPGPPHEWWVLGAMGLVVLGGTRVLARRLTRRLDALRAGVERMGGGDLGARVAVGGSDEVAGLARSFNHAADRIEALVEGQRRMLASASHELRSPLARLQMAVELVAETAPGPERDRLLAEARRDVAELDELVGDLLLSGRMQARGRPADAPEVDVAALAAEEAARVGAAWTGGALRVPGDARALRRLVRNLVENARRHAGGGVEVGVEGRALVVADRGPGVPPEERERIFEPFYRPAGHAEGLDGGVGLGLALVREIARWHGATARHEARPGGGSRFVVDWADAAAPG